MTAPARRPRRRPGGGAGSQTLARLTAAREQLDAALVARRRREDELLTEYAVVTDAVTDAEARRDQALADLERQAAEVRAAAEQELATLEARQGAVLVALHGDRTAEELAHLVTLPVRRVRTLLRAQRDPDEPADAPSSVAAAGILTPPARPAAADSRPSDHEPIGQVVASGTETAPPFAVRPPRDPVWRPPADDRLSPSEQHGG